jgi:hypothetical protein
MQIDLDSLYYIYKKGIGKGYSAMAREFDPQQKGIGFDP